MTNETIADIVAEMRTHASGDAKSAWYTPETWRQLCDRIEAADKRIRAALKPVMECRVVGWKINDGDELPRLDLLANCHNAVRAAQEIMKGETK